VVVLVMCLGGAVGCGDEEADPFEAPSCEPAQAVFVLTTGQGESTITAAVENYQVTPGLLLVDTVSDDGVMSTVSFDLDQVLVEGDPVAVTGRFTSDEVGPDGDLIGNLAGCPGGQGAPGTVRGAGGGVEFHLGGFSAGSGDPPTCVDVDADLVGCAQR
jgi:hypothetical protein